MVPDVSNYMQWGGSLLIAILALRIYPRSAISSLIGVYGIGSVIFQLIQSSSQSLYKNTIGDVYVLFETILLLLVFYQSFPSKRLKQFVVSAASLYCLMYLLLLTSPDFRSTIRTVRDLLMILHALVYFFWLIRHLPENNLLRIPMFWISSAILFFFSATFILSLTMNYIATILREDFILYWSFRNFLRFAFCIIICIGLWRAQQANTVSQQH